MEYKYTLQYTGQGFGMVFPAITADYRYTYYNPSEENPMELNAMLRFPQQLVSIRVKTGDDVFTVPAGETRTLNIFANDWIKKELTDNDFNTELTFILIRPDGSDAPLNPNGEPQITVTGQYTARLLRGIGLVFETDLLCPPGEYIIRYRIKAVASKAGESLIDLSSGITTVKITVLSKGGTLVYYEKYEDNSHGFFAPGVEMAQGLSTAGTIVEFGYVY